MIEILSSDSVTSAIIIVAFLYTLRMIVDGRNDALGKLLDMLKETGEITIRISRKERG